jgi:hypothetical protein
VKLKEFLITSYLFVIAAFLPLLAILKNYLFFQNNDDIFIMGRASGMFYGEPSSELIYISPPLSSLMKFMYSISGEWSWYTLLLVLSQFLAIISYLTLFTKIIAREKPLKASLLTLVVVAPIYIFFILFFSLQFTQTSIIVAGAGILAFIFGDSQLKKNFGLFLIALGIFWRFDAPAIVIAYVIGIVFIVRIINIRRLEIYSFLKMLSPVFIVVALSFSSYFFTFNDWAPWVDEEKKQYVELKNVFTQLYGFESTADSYQDLEKPAQEIGWSENDWSLYQSYYFADSKVFSIEKQSLIAEMRIQENYFSFAISVGKNLFDILKSYSLILIISILFSLLILFFVDKNKILLFVTIWSFTFLTYYLILFFGERLPDRVFWPFAFLSLITLSTVLILSRDSNFRFSGINHYQKLLVFLTSSALIFFFYGSFKEHQARIFQEQWWKTAAQEKILNIDQIYNFQSDKPIMAFFSFYENFRKTIDPVKGPSYLPEIWDQMIMIGWENRTPEFNDRLRKNGLTEDIFQSIAFGDAYLATWTNPEDNFEAEKTSIFLREHKNIEIIWEKTPVVFSDAGFVIWRAADFEVIK